MVTYDGYESTYDGPMIDIDGPLASALIDATCLESNFPGSTDEVSRSRFTHAKRFCPD